MAEEAHYSALTCDIESYQSVSSSVFTTAPGNDSEAPMEHREHGAELQTTGSPRIVIEDVEPASPEIAAILRRSIMGEPLQQQIDRTAPSSPSSSSSSSPSPAAQAKSCRTSFGEFIAASLKTLLFSLIYIPFTITILMQSLVTKRGINPANWESELQGRYWLAAMGFVSFLIICPFIMVYVLANSSGLWGPSNTISGAVSFSSLFYIYIASYLILHAFTVKYAWMRRELCKVKPFTGRLQCSLGNALALASIFFEFAQFVAPFARRAAWTQYAPGSEEALAMAADPTASPGSGTSTDGWFEAVGHFFSAFALRVEGLDYFRATFWMCFAITAVYALCVGFAILINLLPEDQLSGFFFSFLPGTLYLTVMSKMYSAFACIWIESEKRFVLRDKRDFTCWTTDAHRSLMLAAFFGMVMYSSSAMFVGCYRGDSAGKFSDIKYKPKDVVIERTLRGLFAVCTTLIPSVVAVRVIAMAIVLALASINHFSRPCNIAGVTRLKLGLNIAAIWLFICTFLPNGSITSLFTGWISLILFGVGYEIRRRHCNRQPMSEQQITVAPDAFLGLENPTFTPSPSS